MNPELEQMYYEKFERIENQLHQLKKIEDIKGRIFDLKLCEKALRVNNYEVEYPQLKHMLDSLIERLENKEFEYYRDSTKYTLTRLFYKDGRINENLKFTLSMLDKIEGFIRTFRYLNLEDGDLWNEMYNTNDFSIERLDNYMENLIGENINY
jgi:hypothetical protein